MSFMSTIPGSLQATSAAAAAVGAGIAAGNAAAAGPTTALIPSGNEPTSAWLTAYLVAHAALAQATQGEGSMWHQLFAMALQTSGASYDATEAAGALTMG
jgi:hypothetical protein